MTNIKVAGMMRLAEIDQRKLGKDLMKMSISMLAEKVSHIYFLQIGDIDEDVITHINSLGVPVKITPASVDYLSGWMFQNNESLHDLYKTIDVDFDWVLYPDADDLLPENILEIVESANSAGADTIRMYFIECFGSIDKIIEVNEGFPIGPHFKAVRLSDNIGFIGSDGFNEARCDDGLVRYETNYCIRHLRYANPDGIEERKKMNYFQEYFLEKHNLLDYSPRKTFDYYRGHKI
jgi:hypothetical protein